MWLLLIVQDHFAFSAQRQKLGSTRKSQLIFFSYVVQVVERKIVQKYCWKGTYFKLLIDEQKLNL